MLLLIFNNYYVNLKLKAQKYAFTQHEKSEMMFNLTVIYRFLFHCDLEHCKYHSPSLFIQRDHPISSKCSIPVPLKKSLMFSWAIEIELKD